MKIYFFILLFAIQSCVNTKKNISDEELFFQLDKNRVEYSKTKDVKYLKLSYKVLNNNEKFEKDGLTADNRQFVIPLFLNLKKYDELEILLKKDNALNTYNKTILLNVVKFYEANDIDKANANSHIYKNIKLIKDSLNKNQNDSTLYSEYFLMKLYLNGKKKTLLEVDSMQIANKNFSNDYYDLILRDFIKDYPSENLPNKGNLSNVPN